MIEKTTYLNELFDFYGVLLTDKQREYFEYYYFEDLSLSEIAENLNISRNAVHRQLKAIEGLLTEYENKLKLYEKNKKFNNIVNNIQDETLRKQLMELE